MSSVTVAGTIPWRGYLGLAPPAQTLRALRARHGIVIYVQLDAESDASPGSRSTGFRLGPVGPTFFGEGPAIPELGSQDGGFVVGGAYTVTVDVLYGRRHPSDEQRAAAHAEIMRLVLPRWPRPNAADG